MKMTEKKIIIMEDIDCIFTDRKRGDDENHISLQALLNCFDGLTSLKAHYYLLLLIILLSLIKLYLDLVVLIIVSS